MLQVTPFSKLANRDLHDLLKLRQDIFILEQTCLYPDMDGEDVEAEHVLLHAQNRLVGCCRILSSAADSELIILGRIVVCSQQRGQGYAKKLMQYAMSYIRDNKQVNYIKISAQTRLIAFYQGLGFQVTSAPYDEDGIEHIEMQAEVALITF